MTTRFFLYFADRDSALRAADLLRFRGFETETGLGWGRPLWNTIASRQLADSDLEGTDQQMRELVLSLGGSYGGYDERPARPRPAA